MAAYGLLAWGLHPAYFQSVLPQLLASYDAFNMPVEPLAKRLGGLLLLPALLLAVLWQQREERKEWLLWGGQLLAASVALVWQQKGFMNHWYLPVFWCAVLAGFAWPLAHHHPHRLRRLVGIGASMALVLVVAAPWAHGLLKRAGGASDVTAQTAWLKAQPARTVMALSFDLMAAFPSVVLAGKNYVGAYGHLWFGARALYGEPPSEGWQQLADELRRKRPDLLIVTQGRHYRLSDGNSATFDFKQAVPLSGAFWRHYRRMKTIGDQAYYVRTDAAQTGNRHKGQTHDTGKEQDAGL